MIPDTPFAALLRSLPLASCPEIIPITTLHHIDGDASFLDALAVLADHNISAAPVVEAHRVIGFFDHRCAVSAVAASLEEALAGVDEAGRHPALLQALEQVDVLLRETKARDAMMAATRDWAPLPPTASLLDAAGLLAERVHRVVLVEDVEGRHKIDGLLCLSGLVQHIYRELAGGPELQRLLAQPVSAVETGAHGAVIQVQPDCPAHEAVLRMAREGASGVLIVGGHRPITALSRSDLRLCTQLHSFKALGATCLQFITEVRSRSLKTMYPSVHCTPDDPARRLLEKLGATGLHHVFVQQPHSGVIDVVSLRDLLRFLLEMGPSSAPEAA
jgi:CBS-domain-containing membrane protein